MTKVTLDFNDAATGTVVDNEYKSEGVTISSIVNGTVNGSKSPAMIFNTAKPTGGDTDLATSNLGKVLIISEDGDSNDPDDEACGGTLRFDFDENVTFHGLTLLDVEEGAYVKLYDADGKSLGYKYVTTKNNGQCDVNFGAVEGVARMEVVLKGSGAVDNVSYTLPEPESELDGIVEGTAGDDVIDTAYTGDPEGDMIDNNDAILPGEAPNDDIVVAGDGDDIVKSGEGDDEVYGNGGSDTLYGGAGNDILIGDAAGAYGNGAGGETSEQEVFKWSELKDYNGGSLQNGEKIVSQSQDTGDNVVKLTLQKSYDNTFSTDQQKVHSIDTGNLPGANPYSSLESELDDKGDSQTYTLEFEKDAENVSFRINDIDFDSTVVVKAYDANGNAVSVNMTAGSGVALYDNDGVAGKETAVSKGGGQPDTSPTYSALVSAAGPVAKLVITHSQHGNSDSGVNVTDIYFDTVIAGEGSGAEGNDTIYGGDGDDYIEGNGGDDYLNGGEGDDTILGGSGNDEIHGGGGNDTIDGGSGNDYITGNRGDDVIEGGEGDDVIYGQDGNDQLSGGAGNDYIRGGQDADIIDGGDGDDEIYGMSGDDTITGGKGNDYIDGGGGEDTIDGGDGDDTIIGWNNKDTIIGGKGNDTITAGGSDDIVHAGDGNDTVDGGDGNDYIDTSGNIHPVTGLSGTPDQGYPGIWAPDADPNDDKDTVYGGKGNDTIITGDDDDYIEGGEGNDTINAGYDDDIVYGNEGDDYIVGGEGNDYIDGGDGDDIIYGGLDPAFPDALNIPDEDGDLRPDNGDDEIHGGAGNDRIFGQDDDDLIYGDEGDDYLDGGVDDDTIYGGTGNDTIIGGEGEDKLYGDDDRDTFIGGNAGDHVDGGAGGDDYDTLDLTGSGVDYIQYTSPDKEDGIVHFLDGGTMTFEEVENVIPCFTPGTLIATPRGEVAVEDLKVGDKVITRDNGIQEIRWLGRTEVGTVELMKRPELRPVRIAQGALDGNLPERDMLVSPQHRVLVASDRAALYFEEREVLVAAKHLVNGKGIAEAADVASVTYIHFMFDQHEVVLSDGAWTESFQPGDYTLEGLDREQREELLALFPELKEKAGRDGYSAARKTLKKHEALLLTE
ncbi:Hint domain-containing protein [Vannielia litorea]|uniref:Ca2+-binding protein, RTX toxin-related n=1 Tax=Vannielia litorea TaxID=1217970 RepID=A0A1N6F7I5_9RHOB|nr:Hint domain-containing protein [Vannielia litorea]SIN91268.1 Ca2+-binding protein, RTX toxin-related [Vannielia litorea]